MGLTFLYWKMSIERKIMMSKYFMNLDDGDIGFAFDEFGINSKGDPLMRVGDNMITNMKTGEVHFVDSWADDTESFETDFNDEY